ncbi:sigma-70 family RNA polymerase sigma factor [Aneurinibacillus migulanus]|uniref:sigma-70 family RNA polymerase sigma factor n=1 Tax=Aneurinibacillus migulanus TaxID=47500 RepID=UPI0009BC0F7F|nr:sigma-70 family RNA polymerase sigma factor [Aneurinibacillus migulanus]MED0894383.1 sigma-70 family RNA polymerase sigma factor [Aneurinibacillus migulanus]MED1616993.1 sigma-70 family RNA polymerase sigma factor [Aneurinibacillus migulanus]
MIVLCFSSFKDSPSIQKFICKYSKSFSNPVLKNFLKEEAHLTLFIETVTSPTTEKQKALDYAFKKFYQRIRIINFLSTILYYGAIDYDKKNRKYNQKYALILDKPIGTSPEDVSVTMVDLIASPDAEIDDLISSKSDTLEENVSQSSLIRALRTLNDREKEILNLAYLHNMSDRAIALKVGLSHQAIGKARKKSLAKIRSYIGGKNGVYDN